MWDAFIARLRGTTQPEPLPVPDQKLALAALLVRVARSDRFYHVAEIVKIDQIIGASFDLDPVTSAKLRATAEKLEASAPGIEEFSDIIQKDVDYAHRLKIAQQLWEVILADGQDRPEEHDALHDIETHLGIAAPDRRARR